MQPLTSGAVRRAAPEVAQICEEILRDEEDMARWLESQLPLLVQEHLGHTAHAAAGVTNPAGTTRC